MMVRARACARPSGGACTARGRAACGPAYLVLGDDPIDKPVLDGALGLEESVAVHVGVDLLDALSRVVGVDLVDPVTDVEDLPSMDLDVGRLTFEARGGLMDEQAAVGKREALALRAPGQEQRAH